MPFRGTSSGWSGLFEPRRKFQTKAELNDVCLCRYVAGRADRWNVCRLIQVSVKLDVAILDTGIKPICDQVLDAAAGKPALGTLLDQCSDVWKTSGIEGGAKRCLCVTAGPVSHPLGG